MAAGDGVVCGSKDGVGCGSRGWHLFVGADGTRLRERKKGLTK